MSARRNGRIALGFELPFDFVEPALVGVEDVFGQHTYRVESGEDARWLVSTTSGAFAAFVGEVAVPAEGEGYAPADVVPAPADLAAAAARAGIEVLGPPGALPS